MAGTTDALSTLASNAYKLYEVVIDRLKRRGIGELDIGALCGNKVALEWEGRGPWTFDATVDSPAAVLERLAWLQGGDVVCFTVGPKPPGRPTQLRLAAAIKWGTAPIVPPYVSLSRTTE